MWKVALGMVVFMQAGVLLAGRGEAPAPEADVDVEESAVHVGCPRHRRIARVLYPLRCRRGRRRHAPGGGHVAAVAASVPSPTARRDPELQERRWQEAPARRGPLHDRWGPFAHRLDRG